MDVRRYLIFCPPPSECFFRQKLRHSWGLVPGCIYLVKVPRPTFARIPFPSLHPCSKSTNKRNFCLCTSNDFANAEKRQESKKELDQLIRSRNPWEASIFAAKKNVKKEKKFTAADFLQVQGSNRKQNFHFHGVWARGKKGMEKQQLA